MRVRRSDLAEAVRAGVIDGPAADALWRFLCRRPDANTDTDTGTDLQADRGGSGGRNATATPLDLRSVLWSAGGLIVIVGLGLFAIEVSARFGGLALAALATGYGVLFTLVGDALWRRPALSVPGGLLVVAAVAMAPLAVLGVQDHFGWWSLHRPALADGFMRWILGSGVPMALAAALAGIIAMRFYRFAFLAMVIAAATWFIAMDVAVWLAELWPGSLAWMRGLVSIVFGAHLLAAAWLVDLRRIDLRPEGGDIHQRGGRRQSGDVGFWLHLAASLAMLGGALYALGETGAAWAVLCALGVAMVLVSVFLRRLVHALFGALGIGASLVYLSSRVFTDTLVFSFALAAIGIAIMLLGFLYHRTMPRLQDWLARHLPAALQRLRPAPLTR